MDKLSDNLIKAFYDMGLGETIDSESFAEKVKQVVKDSGYIPNVKDGFRKGWEAGYHTAELEYEAVGYVGQLRVHHVALTDPITGERIADVKDKYEQQ